MVGFNTESLTPDSSIDRIGTKHRFSWRQLCRLALIPALFSVGVSSAWADASFPNKPIRFIIPYATGGVSDSIGRVLANAMSKELGQTVVVENRGGGGGTIGAAVVAGAAPDGYTILLTSPPMVSVAPVLLKNLSYDSGKDFTAIGTLVTTPNILVVNKDLPVRNLKDLEKYGNGMGKGKLSFASAGPGSTGHLSGHILQTAMNVEMTHVPYKSSGQAFPDVISGRVSMVFDSLPSTIGHVRSGSVIPVVVMSPERAAVLPDVPTAKEQGFPDATMNFWMGLEGPANIPKPVVDKLNAAMKVAVESPEMQEQLKTLGADTFITSPEEFDKIRKRDIVNYKKLVHDMGLVQD